MCTRLRFNACRGVIVTSILLGWACAVSGQQCGDLIKDINFDYARTTVPYTEDLATQDWAPYSYLDGFWGDKTTKGSNQQRARLIVNGKKTTLEVELPKGCVATECGMQAKAVLSESLEEATMQYMFKFGDDFDWVRGGKLPGLCGGSCVSACQEVTGLDGWSMASVWRPCQWPVVAPGKEITCEGGKLAAYVYHVNKKHWCGDDFDFIKTFKSALVQKDRGGFIQPEPERWYTITNYVKMNTAGSPKQPDGHKEDGILRVWIDGEKVVDMTNMVFRKYNNVSIDTLSFNSFFGGSSDSFRAKKTETIQFDGFKVWEGSCAPRAGLYDASVDPIVPSWPGMHIHTKSSKSMLKASFQVDSIFAGGGCAALILENTSTDTCENWQVEISTRPTWGAVTKFTGLELSSETPVNGWIQLSPKSAALQKLEPGAIMDFTGFCVYTELKAKYLESNFHENIAISAICTKTKFTSSPTRLPGASISSSTRRDDMHSDMSISRFTTSTASTESVELCKGGSEINPSYNARFWPGRLCLDLSLQYDGPHTCSEFTLDLQLDPAVIIPSTAYVSRAILKHSDLSTGEMYLTQPPYFSGMKCQVAWTTSLCMELYDERVLSQDALEDVIKKMEGKCTHSS